jgi:hypothetical protein
MHRRITIGVYLAVLLAPALALSAAGPAFAQDDASPQEIEGGVWALGIHANFPFLGISFRYWLNESTGIEINLAPIPTCDYPEPDRVPPPEPGEEPPPPEKIEPMERMECPNALDLHISGRGLFKVSDNPRADFFLTAGPAFTLKFTQDQPMVIERSMLAVLGEIEISDWPIERVNPVIDYGFAINLQNLYDFRWIAGGVGFHFYF